MKNRNYLFTICMLIGLVSQVNGQEMTDTADYPHSAFQLSFFPPLSTNGLDNANYINEFSLNVIAGVSGGVDGVELGSVVNINRYYVHGFQGAGFGNTVGGNVDGVQLSGFCNVVGGSVRYVQGAGFINVTGGGQVGLQGAGFANVVGGGMAGFQGAGFANVVGRDASGVQGAGFGNFTGGSFSGIQGAGFMNMAGDSVMGIQGAGFLNIAGSTEKCVQAAGFGNISGGGKTYIQGAGFFNVADSVEGVQGAGFINVAEEVHGLQGAGFMNIAGYVKGVQAAGFINVCDSIDGVPIGFISIVKHGGYRSLEIATSEIEYVDVSFRLGVEKLYTIYKIGKPYGGENRWMFGAGLGTQWGLNDRMNLNVEAMHNVEIYVGHPDSPWFFDQSRFNIYDQLRASFDYEIGNFASLFIGPTLNISIAETEDYDGYIPWEPIAPKWTFVDRNYGQRNMNVALWFGLRGGIRF